MNVLKQLLTMNSRCPCNCGKVALECAIWTLALEPFWMSDPSLKASHRAVDNRARRQPKNRGSLFRGTLMVEIAQDSI